MNMWDGCARRSRKPSLGCDGVTKEIVFLAVRTTGALLTGSKNWKNWSVSFLWWQVFKFSTPLEAQAAQRRRRAVACTTSTVPVRRWRREEDRWDCGVAKEKLLPSLVCAANRDIT